MKHARKLTSLLLALVMVFALAVTVAAEGTTEPAKGSITISNAAKGETYTIYKLFDATVSEDGKSIAYTGEIPASLNTYFTADKNHYISATPAATDGANMSEGLKAALKDWTKTATATAKATSDGSALNFNGLAYGYYVVTTTQGNQVISVDSTMPNAIIVDKNSSAPKDLTKTASEDDVYIGDTVTYTVRFKTSNYYGAGKDAKEIVSYTIEDTLPDFLSDVKVTSIIVDNDGNEATTGDGDQVDVTAQFAKKKIVIDWYDEDNSKFLYNNGATVTITYTAKVTDNAAIDGTGNTNKVTVTWTTKNGTEPGPGELKQEETIYTYAIALKKVNNKGTALPGAVFEFPFYVNSVPDANGAYIYAGITAGEGLTNQITTPDSGVIVVKGVKSGDYEITEFKAPAGYNKLTAPVTVEAVKTGETSTHTTVYLDKDGNKVNESAKVFEVKVDIDTIAATAVVVVNKAGTELPSTGGMGTTIFYVLGAVLVVGAGVLLVTKKRMSQSEI
mgnify:CR=1 FL=1